MQISKFGSNLGPGNTPGGSYTVSNSLNMGKVSVFATANPQHMAMGILNTDGNKSLTGMSQGDMMSH